MYFEVLLNKNFLHFPIKDHLNIFIIHHAGLFFFIFVSAGQYIKWFIYILNPLPLTSH